MKKLLSLLSRDEAGASFTEYGLLLIFVVIAIAIGTFTFSDSIVAFLNNIGTDVADTPTGLP